MESWQGCPMLKLCSRYPDLCLQETREGHHSLLTSAVKVPLLGKIQGNSVWEDFVNSWLWRTQSRQTAGGNFRVIACTDPELVACWMEWASFPSAELWDNSCSPSVKWGGLTPSTTPRNERQNRRSLSGFWAGCETAAAPSPCPEAPLELLTTLWWPQHCQHCAPTCFHLLPSNPSGFTSQKANIMNSGSLYSAGAELDPKLQNSTAVIEVKP